MGDGYGHLTDVIAVKVEGFEGVVIIIFVRLHALVLFHEIVRFFDAVFRPFPGWMQPRDREVWEAMQSNAEKYQRHFDVAWLMTQECTSHPFAVLSAEEQEKCKRGVLDAYVAQMKKRGVEFDAAHGTGFDALYAQILKDAVTMGTLQRQPKVRAVMVLAAAHVGLAQLSAYAPTGADGGLGMTSDELGGDHNDEMEHYVRCKSLWTALRCNRFTALTSRNTAQAMIRKLMTAIRKDP